MNEFVQRNSLRQHGLLFLDLCGLRGTVLYVLQIFKRHRFHAQG